MLIKLSHKFCFMLTCLLGFTLASGATTSTTQIYKPSKIHFYKNIAISSAKGHGADGVKTKGGSKLVIQSFSIKQNPSTNAMERLKGPILELGPAIWSITIEQLHITVDHCYMSYTDPCENENQGRCYKPCFTSSPKFIAFDENRGKLYFDVAATDIGTGGGTYFTFVADINKKEIKFLHNESGPLDGYLSPSGKYLLIRSFSRLNVYNTLTDELFIINKETIFGPPEKVQLHYIDNIKWLSDTQFTYEDQVSHSKFQDDVDSITEYTVDIPSKKTLSSRTIKANIYVYKNDAEKIS